jgi:hypothetical protein
MQRREKGARLDDERAGRDLLDPARDTQAVQFGGGERLQDQEIEGSPAAEWRGVVASRTPLLSTVYTTAVCAFFLSNVNRNVSLQGWIARLLSAAPSIGPAAAIST